MRLSRAFTLVLLIGRMVCSVAWAQTPTRISLEDAIKLAIDHSHTLKAAQSQIPQNQANEVTANLRPNPLLSWDAQFMPIFEPSQFTSTFLNDNAQYDLGIG